MVLYTPAAPARFLPVIGLGGDSTDPAAVDAIAGEVHRACRDTGFFYVTDHGIPDDLITAQLDWTRRFLPCRCLRNRHCT